MHVSSVPRRSLLVSPWPALAQYQLLELSGLWLGTPLFFVSSDLSASLVTSARPCGSSFLLCRSSLFFFFLGLNIVIPFPSAWLCLFAGLVVVVQASGAARPEHAAPPNLNFGGRMNLWVPRTQGTNGAPKPSPGMGRR
ncbi:hypothetical protein METBIDRAFT_198619 [Metschnikowia bicuspidata var. bicuspidata NRRL YB-4993]|uniref:Uncharacterized protein n=1 Tax=Metschnikowia bicuspidata var. bicuspidata NRRL YB-4993 TaxID=869754 RepID=A0A1A0H968_9ASCO|nr:hypothetical protein METBIDRAFT_198619 [Metschnikowia bicuspidata var. bicuspidata NRRL YB-4993]OBA20423.1 hypothetical protein METBIDRAFT_198619 [Metschnikowia bicuspidata var. bicuspidata NRRL YB-4993]